MTVKIGVEKWDYIWPACEPLMRKHFEEVKGNRALLPFKADYKTGQLLEDYGNLIVIAARDNDRLVGYLIWFLGPNIESMGETRASQGPWFVLKEYRGVGTKMLELGIEKLRERGIKVVNLHHTLTNLAIGKYFEKLGARIDEIHYELGIANV